MSDEQNDALELERTRLERVKAEETLLQRQQEIEAVQQKERQLKQQQALKDAVLAEGVPRFYNIENALTLAQRPEFDVRFSDDGTATGTVDGKRVPLFEVFKAIALDPENAALVDGRSLRGLRETEEQSKPCRSEMSQSQKIAFIEKHGLKAFEELPVRRTRLVEVRTFADYLALPREAKMEFINRNGPDATARLPRK
jgi:hypothetical protein